MSTNRYSYEHLTHRARFLLCVASLVLTHTVSEKQWKEMMLALFEELADHASKHLTADEYTKLIKEMKESLSEQAASPLADKTADDHDHRLTVAYAGTWMMELASRSQ